MKPLVPFFVAASALFTACGSEELNPATPRHTDLVGDGINATGVGAGTGAYTGLPCDVQQLLETRCIACHLNGGSVAPLLTYEDLLKASAKGTSLAQESLARMKSATAPMPPAGAKPPTPEEIQVLQTWVSAGTPKESAACTGGGQVAPAFDTPSVCTSNKTWRGVPKRATG
jgi:mono/diheme cytochrome c family protein